VFTLKTFNFQTLLIWRITLIVTEINKNRGEVMFSVTAFTDKCIPLYSHSRWELNYVLQKQ